MLTEARRKKEFGDFQTPDSLCQEICSLLTRLNVSPKSVVEPTCGSGSFLRAATREFSKCKTFLGFDINSDYVRDAQGIENATVRRANVFVHDWSRTFAQLFEPVLVVGNLPWVTNTTMSAVRGANVPTKSNRQRDKGISAITGKSNFDISEWILLHFLNRLSGRSAVLAMLCKSVVARKVLRHAWANRLQLKASAIYFVDASRIFGVAVDACLLICTLEPNERSRRCLVYSNLESTKPKSLWGLHRGHLAADLEAANATGHLMGRSPVRWRSGIKHDCASVMELFSKRDGYFRNGLGETVSVESTFLFPMLKSSELVQSLARPSRFMLVTQRSVGDDTAQIKAAAPKTWNYLESHAHRLDARASAIYKNRPRFSVFGVGKYTFAPWKVAISGFLQTISILSYWPGRW